jgi:hypothetical protein
MEAPRRSPTRARRGARPPRVLVLGEPGFSSGDVPRCDILSWGEAQQGAGISRLGLYDRYLCLPARFPRAVVEHARERLCQTLRRRVEEGALVAFLVPGSDPVTAAIDADWSRTRFVVEAVTGLRLDPVEGGTWPALRVAPHMPAALAHLLREQTPSFTLERSPDPPARPLSHDRAVALAGFGGPEENPTAAAALAGTGAWAVLPAGSGAPSSLSALLALLDDLEQLRADWTRERARRGTARPLEARRRGSSATAAVAPRDLPEAHLLAVPVDGSRGALHYRPRGAVARSSHVLGRGAWVVATVLLAARRFEADHQAPIDLAEVEEALRDADVPATKRASVRGYLAQLRRAVEAALGRSLPPRAIVMPRGGRAIAIAGLRRLLGPAGASVRSIRTA